MNVYFLIKGKLGSVYILQRLESCWCVGVVLVYTTFLLHATSTAVPAHEVSWKQICNF